MNGIGFRFPVLLLTVLTAVAAAFSQVDTGEIRLEVKDPAGNDMQARGTLTSVTGEFRRTFETDGLGRFTLENLPYGRYTLQLSREGFATESLFIDLYSKDPAIRTVTMAIRTVASNVDVVSVTPIAGVELQLKDIAAPVQSGTEADIELSGAVDLSDFLNRRLDAVHLTQIQGNPFQADLNYRGYTASPLLGTPQGLSVYMDGVRLNQPFGDVVSWDLIPRIAISEATLMPGSNPVFGLNTLGGALSIQTKDGEKDHGTSAQISGGSFRRATLDVENGGSNNKSLSWYSASSLFFENGWRDDSPSNVRQFFGKLAWQRDKTSLRGSIGFANNSLTGNGLQEQRFLEQHYSSVYTRPDVTNNRSPFVNFRLGHSFRTNLTLSANAYYRYIQTSSLNGDLNEDSLDQSVYQPSAAEQAALIAAGYTGITASGATVENTPFPFWRCLGNVLLRDEPAERCNALLNRTATKQHNSGTSGQLTWFGSPNGQHNQLTVGVGYDRGSVRFRQSTELGFLNPDRSITGTGAFGDGVSGGNVDGEPFDTRVDLHGVIHTGSVYATDTLSLAGKVSLTLSGRYNRTTVDNHDGIAPQPGTGSLTGRHLFSRLSPAVGVTFSPAGALNLYFGYSEASRAPTSIELGCADPAQPCKLPNAMAGDPFLKQVVARTWEAGVRHIQERGSQWSLGAFRDDNKDDILFVASEQTGFGYFKNFAKTRRQGVEIQTRTRVSRFVFGAGYTLLDATYQSAELVNGSGNSTNGTAKAGVKGVQGTMQIDPGDRIPLTPRHMVKAFTDVRMNSKWNLDFDVIAFSSSYARGNENNQHQPDGLYYLGPGVSPRYAVFDLGSHYQLTPKIQLFAQLNNVFNRKYYTAAQLGPTGFTAAGTFIARPFPAVDGAFPVQRATFYAPGAPRSAWAGLRVTF